MIQKQSEKTKIVTDANVEARLIIAALDSSQADVIFRGRLCHSYLQTALDRTILLLKKYLHRNILSLLEF